MYTFIQKPSSYKVNSQDIQSKGLNQLEWLLNSLERLYHEAIMHNAEV